MISIWEKNSFIRYDYIVIGAGITGLSAAISIKERYLEAEVLVLEKGILPTGASTKNAGFACFGSVSEILDDYEKFGKDISLQLIEERVRGLELLKKRLGEKNIDLRYDGGYELIFEDNNGLSSRVESLNQDLRGIFKESPFQFAAEKIKSFGFAGAKELIFTPFEGQLDTGKMMKALWYKAGSMGVFIQTGTHVLSIDDDFQQTRVRTKEQSYECRKAVICTNAFAGDLIDNANITPARGLVISTHPVKDLPFRGSFHFDKGFYYFRNFHDRIIFGGGRNLDISTEQTTAFEVNQKILDNLKEKMREIILPKTPFKIDLTWTGIMGFGKSKFPIIKMHSENVAVAVGLGGMGVALGSNVGQKVARLIC